MNNYVNYVDANAHVRDKPEAGFRPDVSGLRFPRAPLGAICGSRFLHPSCLGMIDRIGILLQHDDPFLTTTLAPSVLLHSIPCMVWRCRLLDRQQSRKLHFFGLFAIEQTR